LSTGKEFGVIVTTPLAGLLCASNFLGGWPAAFYVFGKNDRVILFVVIVFWICIGIITCIWFIFWCFFAYNSPLQHPRCSEKERWYLTASLPKPKKVCL
jgi:ACS family sodium-dependent inorganic phosphate cotransporter-like MFS transporter 5